MQRRMILSFVGLLSLLAFGAAAQEETAEFRQWAYRAEASTQYGDEAWSAQQATGAPDTFACGDFGTAWASASSGETATLTVYFQLPVRATEVNIHQTYNPGAITRIELLHGSAENVSPVPDSGDPGTACPGVLRIPVPDDLLPVDGVIIYLDQSLTNGWNEIDAVELVGELPVGSAIEQWADYGMAGTQRGDSAYSASQVIGMPEALDCADAGTSWASAVEDGEDQLVVLFPYLVVPTRLDIHQNYNPGAVVGVDLITSTGGFVTVTDSAAPDTACPGVLSLEVQTDAIVMGAVISLDQSRVEDVTQIDAVRLAGTLADDGLARQWASSASATSQYGEISWSAAQATGAPNTFGCGDFGTAWASQTSTGQDSLTLMYDQPVIPTSVYIYQTYNPGAIIGVDLLPADGGDPIPISGVEDAPAIPCPGILIVDVLEDAPPVTGVTIHLDQTRTGSWNEIDAVRLTGRPVAEE